MWLHLRCLSKRCVCISTAFCEINRVQHPGIWHEVCTNFYIMSKAAKFLESLPCLNLRHLSILDTVTQFRDVMLPQLDLTLEAKHLQRFNRDFSNDRRVSFPKPLEDLTGTRILTKTFVQGRPMLECIKEDMATRKELANLGLETTLKMIFLNDFLHGDSHPGVCVAWEQSAHNWLRQNDWNLTHNPDSHPFCT